MSTYEETTTEENRQRNHPTLTNVLDAFMTESSSTSSNNIQGNQPTSAELERFVGALRSLGTEDGSTLAQDLMESIQAHPEQKGISQDYLDSLDRVDVKNLTKEDDCPICTNRFVDDNYPLIVKLPCNAKTKHRGHIFDLECIGPWLKMNSTCPLCRFDLLELQDKRKKRLEDELKQLREQDDEESEEDWDMYG